MNFFLFLFSDSGHLEIYTIIVGWIRNSFCIEPTYVLQNNCAKWQLDFNSVLKALKSHITPEPVAHVSYPKNVIVKIILGYS